MADFELLSVYISIRTRGLQTVLRDFARAREAAQRLAQHPVHVNTQRAADAARRFRDFLSSTQISMQRLARSGRPLQAQFQALERIQARLQRRLAAGNITVQQRERLEARINAVIRRREQLEGQAERRRQRAVQALNSISLEAGFLAPFTRVSGNLFRIATGFRELARSAGLGAAGIRLAGAAGVAFGIAIKGIQIALNVLASVVGTLARVALAGLRVAFQTLLGPTLAFLRIVRQLIQALPILAAVVGGVLTRSLIRTAAEFQRITSGFEFAFGPGAQAELSRVIALANRLGVPLEAITGNYVRISSAARDAGIAQADVRELMEGVSSAAVALGLDVERVNGLFFAFEQVISKGKLTAEELRRQIGDRLPGAFAIAARSLGVTTAELDQLLEQGAVDAAQFIRSIGAELNRTFGTQAARQANRLTASLNRLNNQWQLMRIALASGIEPALVGIIQQITRLINAVRNSAAFQTFTRFLVGQLRVIEANFQRMVTNVRGIIAQLAPTFQRLGRLILVLNTISIGTIIESVRRLQPVFDAIIGRVERFVTALTGVSFEGLGFNLQSVIAIAEALPLIFDAISLRIRLAFERFRNFLSAVTLGMSNASSFLVRTVGNAVQEVIGIVGDAFTQVGAQSEAAASMARELEFRWQTIGFVIQNALDRTNALRFEQSILGLARRFVNLEAGVFGFVTTIFAGIERINASTREVMGLAAEAQQAGRGTGQIVNITELRNIIESSVERRDTAAIAASTQATERNTSAIADTVARLDQRIAELPDIVETLVRSSILALPGGGLSR